MSTTKIKQVKKETDSSKRRRANPVAAKAGYTKTPGRRYGCGGKLK